MAVRLTEYSRGGGCGCKLSPSLLTDALSGLPMPVDSALLVGADTGDDAAVWRHGEEAIVFTTDFFTPIVDDARSWGRIAATNAVSDIYAMGGTPRLGLNLVSWNSEALGIDLLREVLQGGADVARTAGFFVAGGHSIEDPEPKYGMAVLGTVDPEQMLLNSGFRPGDVLVLSKPIGVGLITTAAKRDMATSDQLRAAIDVMTMLNGDASRIALEAGATGATDVTGFGLVGHLGRAMRASSTDAVIDVDSVPVLEGARELATRTVPGGTGRNLAWVDAQLDGFDDDAVRNLLGDPQTSGGLLFGVAPEAVRAVLDSLVASGHQPGVVGQVIEGDGRLKARSRLGRP